MTSYLNDPSSRSEMPIMSNDADDLCLVTPDNGLIPVRILNVVRDDAARVVPTLEYGRQYRAADICASSWDALSTQGHKDAGRALKYLANSGLVGLVCIGMDSSHHALYVRIDSRIS